MCIALLHDVREDWHVADSEIRGPFGNFVADGVDYMTKTFPGVRRNDVDLFDQMALHAGASVCKPADRINNQGSKVGVFGTAKMASYMEETTELFLPMLKKAKRNLPELSDPRP